MTDTIVIVIFGTAIAIVAGINVLGFTVGRKGTCSKCHKTRKLNRRGVCWICFSPIDSLKRTKK